MNVRVNRRAALSTLCGAVSFARGPVRRQPLLISGEELVAARKKAQRNAWAEAIYRDLMRRSQEALASPLDVPDRPGQWGHWYVCSKDGSPLVADSPTRHRCPLCGAIYTGEPYDSVYIAGIHSKNGVAMRDLALAYAFTNRPEYARRAGELLDAYAKRYLSYPRHDVNGKDTVTAGRLTSQTLDESVWLIPVVWAYSLMRETLTPELRTQIESRLLKPAAATIIGPSFDHLPNIQCWKNSAIGCVGYALEDHELISTALDDPTRGFRTLMSRYVVSGGVWAEGSMGYQLYALSALWPLAEAARRHGVDLYANENYRSLFDGPVALALPNGDPAGYNDNPGSNLSAWTEVYDLAYARWKRPEYGRVAGLGARTSTAALLYGEETLPSGDCIPKTSVLIRQAGLGAMRSADATVEVRSGMHGGGHGHPDMLNIVTFGKGRLFGVDPGSIGYGAALHREWYRSTIAHNTVCVDQQLQSNADGSVIDWTQDAAATSWKGAANVYASVTLTREVRLGGNRASERFTCESPDEHVYDWAFHSLGELTVSIATKPLTGLLGNDNGYQHIRDAREAAVETDWMATWRNGDAILTLHVKGAPATTLFTGVGPGPNPAEPVAMILIRRKERKAVFEVEHVFSGAR